MLRPKVVVELDEPSHARAERQARDAHVERVEAAGAAVVRVPHLARVRHRELEHALRGHLCQRSGVRGQGSGVRDHF